jgi:hypothetical protein
LISPYLKTSEKIKLPIWMTGHHKLPSTLRRRPEGRRLEGHHREGRRQCGSRVEADYLPEHRSHHPNNAWKKTKPNPNN